MVLKRKHQKRIDNVKLAARSELKLSAWVRNNHKDLLAPLLNQTNDNVDRIDYLKISPRKFIKHFEKKNIPIVIENALIDWDANKNWTPQALKEKYYNEKFKIGEDDDGKTVYTNMKTFMKYCDDPDMVDDSPLYIFDSSFGERTKPNSYVKRKREGNKRSISPIKNNNPIKKIKSESSSSPSTNNTLSPSSSITTIIDRITESSPTCKLLQDYAIPTYFQDDLFQLAGERRRPPYRWIVIGPERSGTGIHIDPLNTSAWNALIIGKKRWCLFPPTVEKKIIDPGRLGDHEASTWFAKVYPRMNERAEGEKQTLGQKLGMLEILQNEGETVFVPGGWNHVVINITFTIAVTQNFASFTNFEQVWLKTRHSRPNLSRKIVRELKNLEKGLTNTRIYKYISQHLKAKPPSFFSDLLDKIKKLETVPEVEPSSSSSSSSSSTTSSESEGEEDHTASESSVDGRCFCSKCKKRRKKSIAENNNSVAQRMIRMGD